MDVVKMQWTQCVLDQARDKAWLEGVRRNDILAGVWFRRRANLNNVFSRSRSPVVCQVLKNAVTVFVVLI